MYDLTFKATNGTSLVLNYENGIIISRVNGATGLPVSVQTAQGYQQVGNSVSSQTVNGRDIILSGYIFKENAKQKLALMKAFAPFMSGRLFWENKYFIDVIVKNAPEVSQNRDSAFSLRLYAAFPFWSATKKESQTNGRVVKEFSFPINYATPHRFGTKNNGQEYSVYNAGEVSTPIEISILGDEKIVNPQVTNVETGSFLKFNGELDIGETFRLYQDSGKIRATITRINGEEENAISMLDDDSSLFELQPGDNRFQTTADEGALNLVSTISFYPLYSGVLMNGV